MQNIKNRTLLVTGGAGFIGSNFIRHIIENTKHKIINIDKLSYAGNLDNLGDIPEKHPERYKFMQEDICDSSKMHSILESNLIDSIINFAAETHVDRSIVDSDPFLQTNVIGTGVLLKTALNFWKEDFCYTKTRRFIISTATHSN